jgi:hypothetical protein
VLVIPPDKEIAESTKGLLLHFIDEYREKTSAGVELGIKEKYFILAMFREFDRFRNDGGKVQQWGKVIDLKDLTQKDLAEMWARTKILEGKTQRSENAS